jgi:hypothetical protein
MDEMEGGEDDALREQERRRSPDMIIIDSSEGEKNPNHENEFLPSNVLISSQLQLSRHLVELMQEVPF